MRFTPLHLQQLNAVVFAIADVNVSAVDEHAVRCALGCRRGDCHSNKLVLDGSYVGSEIS